jgi:cytochrome P450
MLRDPIGLFTEARHRYGDLVTMRALHQPLVAVNGPREMHQVLVSRARRYEKDTVGYRTLSLLLGAGLVTAEGETWKRHRKVANPAFHRACLAGFAETMNVAAADAVAGWAATPTSPATSPRRWPRSPCASPARPCSTSISATAAAPSAAA